MTHPRYLPHVLAAAREANAQDVAAIEVAVHRQSTAVITEHSSTGTTRHTILDHPDSVVTVDSIRARALAWCGMMRRTVPDPDVRHRAEGYPDPLWNAVRARLAANALAPDVAAARLRLLRAAHDFRLPQYDGIDHDRCGLARIAHDVDHPRKGYRMASAGEVVLVDPDREPAPGFVYVWGLDSVVSTALALDDLTIITPPREG